MTTLIRARLLTATLAIAALAVGPTGASALTQARGKTVTSPPTKNFTAPLFDGLKTRLSEVKALCSQLPPRARGAAVLPRRLFLDARRRRH